MREYVAYKQGIGMVFRNRGCSTPSLHKTGGSRNSVIGPHVVCSSDSPVCLVHVPLASEATSKKEQGNPIVRRIPDLIPIPVTAASQSVLHALPPIRSSLRT